MMQHGKAQRGQQQQASAPDGHADQGGGSACAEHGFGHAAAERRADALLGGFLHQHQQNYQDRHDYVERRQNYDQKASHLNYLNSSIQLLCYTGW
jgi:hypothetical protein